MIKWGGGDNMLENLKRREVKQVKFSMSPETYNAMKKISKFYNMTGSRMIEIILEDLEKLFNEKGGKENEWL